MRIAITGASGFVGRALAADLARSGDQAVALVRRSDNPSGTAHWNTTTGTITDPANVPFDAIVHLAGENIAAKRWTAARRRALVDSRVGTTERLCRALAAARHRPTTLIAASAIGIYGSRGDELLDDGSTIGRGFLAELTRDWEAATAPAAAAGIRVVNVRIGLVLDRSGGALARMLPPFRLGLGGRLGHGRQWMSWIALADLVAVLRHCLRRDELHGPIVAAAPQPCTNREFTKALGQVLHRPTFLPVPAFALRLLLGAMADEALLASQRARPARLLADGFRFTHERIGDALAAALRR